MFERVQSEPLSLYDAHKKWPDKAILCYDVIDEPYWMSRFNVYGMADSYDECLDAVPLFKLEYPDKECEIVYTSPVDEGRPVFNE